MIGTLRESPLHAAIKRHCARPGDRFEVPLEGFIIDLVRSHGELVEVQTGSFWPLRPKLERLLDFYPMRVVHPIAAERRVIRVDAYGTVLSSRRSRQRGKFLDVFEHLVSFPTLLTHPNFVLELLLCHEEQRKDGRHLVEIVDRLELKDAHDVAALLLTPDPFTTASLAKTMHISRPLAQRFVYCLKALEIVSLESKQGRTPVYIASITRGRRGNTAATARLDG